MLTLHTAFTITILYPRRQWSVNFPLICCIIVLPVPSKLAIGRFHTHYDSTHHSLRRRGLPPVARIARHPCQAVPAAPRPAQPVPPDRRTHPRRPRFPAARHPVR